MKKLEKLVGIGLCVAGASITSLLISLGAYTYKKEAEKYTDLESLKGIVFSEKYMPATAGGFMNPSIKSRYSFSLDIENERKVFEVESTSYLKKENIDALIEPGTIVEVQIKKGTNNQRDYTIPTDTIKVIK